MTRETKIGLLVGLAFIIVIGILLSEHLTTTTERPMAPLAEAGHGVREGVTAPGTQGLDQPVAPRPAEPRQQIPIAREITPPQPGPAPQVTIGGPTDPQPNGQQTIIVRGETPAPAQTVDQPILPQNTDVGPIITKNQPTHDPFANDPVMKAAAERGQPMVPIDPKKSAEAMALAVKAKEYKAQPGDTLSRIAALLPGGSTKANRDAIVKLNPTLQKDPNKIISGRMYLLPTENAGNAKAAVDSKEQLVKADALPKPEVKPPEPKPDAKPEDKSTATRVYVVKAGDTLTKIATAELGSKAEVGTIRKLNEDVLKGGDAIKVDMKLKLPAKQVAKG